MKIGAGGAKMLLSGLLLAGLPMAAIARHNHIEIKDVRFSVPAKISPHLDTENLDIWTDINRLDLTSLSGPDQFLRGQTVYVHMAKGPDTIAYPFAITNNKPRNLEPRVFTIRGKITGVENNHAIIRYNFETILPSKKIRQRFKTIADTKSEARLAVNKQGVPRLVSLGIDGETFKYRRAE